MSATNTTTDPEALEVAGWEFMRWLHMKAVAERAVWNIRRARKAETRSRRQRLVRSPAETFARLADQVGNRRPSLEDLLATACLIAGARPAAVKAGRRDTASVAARAATAAFLVKRLGWSLSQTATALWPKSNHSKAIYACRQCGFGRPIPRRRKDLAA